MNLRNLIALWAAALLMHTVSAQEEARYFKLKGSTQLQECSKEGSTTSFGTKNIPGGSKFTVVGTSGDNNIIQLWNWDTTGYQRLKRIDSLTAAQSEQMADAEKARLLNFNPVTGAIRYFLISKSEMAWNAAVLIQQWNPVFGTAILPFKFRSHPFEFSANFSLAALGGVRFTIPTRRFSVAGVIGGGLTTVQLDKLNTKGGVPEVSDRSAAFFASGLVLQYDRVQFVVVTGADWVSTRERKGWIYQGKPWVTFGVGFAIFSEERSPKQESGQNE